MNPKILILLCASFAFVGGCASNTQKSTGTQRLQAQFERADTNNDGKVARKEFGGLMIEDAFALFDNNKDGVVTLKEYVTSGGTKEGFAELDVNGNGKITLQEAKATKVAMDAMTVSFYGADLNGDGYVTLEEALKYREQTRPYIR